MVTSLRISKRGRTAQCGLDRCGKYEVAQVSDYNNLNHLLTRKMHNSHNFGNIIAHTVAVELEPHLKPRLILLDCGTNP